jgi:Acyl-CoA dehydrogenases
MDLPRQSAAAAFVTHEVDNQPPELSPYDAFATDQPLREALARAGGEWGMADIAAYGPLVGGEMMELARLANENRPRFKPFDRFGHRTDRVEFHPAYHRLMQLGVEHGVTGYAWRHANRPAAQVVRAALAYLDGQADQGTSCPLTMTYASQPTLQQAPAALAREWAARAAAPYYDARELPVTDKSGITVGMGMTEKQGGSDVRSNRTRAHALGDGNYELVGHKWFFSAPMCDGHLVLAQADGGLSCFLVPRLLDDGRLNAVRIQRLKDKLGDWSNASAEVEFCGALGWRVGEEGRGVPTIIQMVALTRLDCVIGSAAIMRQALVQAIHHARHRSAFGRPLAAQPLMQAVLGDLALESEAAMALALRVARAVDAAPRDAGEAALARVITPIAKFWVCKRCAPAVNEAQECLGGNGYVEEATLARLYRQAPLNSIWEGSGNVQCLDVLRVARREPEALAALLAELERVRGAHPAYDHALDELKDGLADAAGLEEIAARRWVGLAARLLQAAILLDGAPETVAQAFCGGRLAAPEGSFGVLPAGTDAQALIARAFPD